MAKLLAYSIVAGSLLTVAYFSLRIALRGVTFHSFRRVMMLTTLVVALSFPVVLSLSRSEFQNLAESSSLIVDSEVSDIDVVFVPVVAKNVADAGTPLFMQLLLVGYMVGLIFCAGRFIISLMSTIKMIVSSRRIGKYGRWILLTHQCRNFSSFGWGRYMLMAEDEVDNDAVLKHECSHLDHLHWVDLLVAELAAIVLWYWPTVWLLRNDLAELHEYQADEDVASSGIDVREYQLMLLKKAAGTRFHSIACSLNHSNISKRIKMMLRKKSRPAARLRAVMAVPMVALGVSVLCGSAVASAVGSVSDAKVTNFSADVQQNLSDSIVYVINDRRATVKDLDTIPAENIDGIWVLPMSRARYLMTEEEIAAGKTQMCIVRLKGYTPDFIHDIWIENPGKDFRISLNGIPADDDYLTRTCVFIIDGKRASLSEYRALKKEDIESVYVSKVCDPYEFLTEEDIASGHDTQVNVILKH